MARLVTSEFLTAVTSQAGTTLALAALLDFSSGAVGYHSGGGTLTFPDGTQFTRGVGALGRISTIRESVEVRADRVSIGVSGVESSPSLNLSSFLTEDIRGRLTQIWLVAIDANDVVVDAPLQIFAGRMDNVDIEQSAEELDIMLNVESIVADWRRPKILRTNNETQRQRKNGATDKGFEFAEVIAERTLQWGIPRV